MGRRIVLLAALVLAVVSAIIFLSASSTWWLLAARFVSGVAVGVITPAAAAAIAELEPHHNLHRASMVTAVVTVGALGAGPLVAGLLAQYGGSPRTLPWQVYLGVLCVAALMVLAVPETVGDRTRGVAGIRPRLIHLPRNVRRPFTEAITTAVVGFGTLGFFSSLVPSLVKASLHRPNHALGGAVVFILYAAVVAGQFAGKRLGRSRSILSGLIVTAVGLAVVVAAFATTTLWLLVVGAVVCGLGVGLAVIGGLALVNQVCPPGHRAEILSAFFVVTYVSAAVPVVLSAVMADHGGSVAATSMVAGLIGLLIVVTLVIRLQQRRYEGLAALGSPPGT
jgi:MFS family permease